MTINRDLNIFEDRLGKDKIGFNLVMPGVMIGSTNIQVEFKEGQWHLTHTDSIGSVTAQHEYKIGALLKLITIRCGFEVEIT